MATTDRSANTQRKACSQLLEVYFDSLPSTDNLLNQMINDGIIDIGRLNEVVESNLSGIPLESGAGHDLADGTDCKYATVSTNNVGYHIASIRTSGSQADYRVRIYHPTRNQWYTGQIPHEVIGGVAKKTVGICFRKDGTMSPRWSKYFKKGIEPLDAKRTKVRK